MTIGSSFKYESMYRRQQCSVVVAAETPQNSIESWDTIDLIFTPELFRVFTYRYHYIAISSLPYHYILNGKVIIAITITLTT